MNKHSYLQSLKESHAKIDDMIASMGKYPGLSVQQLKKKKLVLKQKIVQIENEINENSNFK